MLNILRTIRSQAPNFAKSDYGEGSTTKWIRA